MFKHSQSFRVAVTIKDICFDLKEKNRKLTICILLHVETTEDLS